MGTVGVVVVAVAASAALVAGCSRSVAGHGQYSGRIPGSKITVFDPVAVEHTIVSESAKSGSPITGVVCPDDEVVQKGRTFDCHADDGITIQIKITSSSGDYLWSPMPAGH